MQFLVAEFTGKYLDDALDAFILRGLDPLQVCRAEFFNLHTHIWQQVSDRNLQEAVDRVIAEHKKSGAVGSEAGL